MAENMPNYLQFNNYLGFRYFALTSFMAFTLCILLELQFLMKPEYKMPTPVGISHNHISAFFQGRMGNHLFLYASLIGIANSTNMEPFVPPDCSLWDILELKAKKGGRSYHHLGRYIYFKENLSNTYDARTQEFDTDTYIDESYLQSWRYFNHIRNTIKEHYTFKPEIKNAAEKYIQNVVRNDPKGVTKIGIHIRRGDFLQDYFKDYGYVVATADYIHKAMKYMREQFQSHRFFICTDDHSWARLNIPESLDVTFVSSTSAIDDFALLASMDHMIMTQGSFGWWAAYLAGGTTVYFTGYPRPGSELDKQFNKRDYYLSEWIGMA
ncbi:unnamed protein product [Owenia fusiformis]|uniref:L-Fucosyltransferase n=1 Tax=Owenia fusiformis TaxID=6347 RepID=A0A8J1UB42_OWEFU|nr:unnamed protein product [Owenia fusiformis]